MYIVVFFFPVDSTSRFSVYLSSTGSLKSLANKSPFNSLSKDSIKPCKRKREKINTMVWIRSLTLCFPLAQNTDWAF